MTITKRIVVTAAVLTIMSASTAVAAQQRPYRVSVDCTRFDGEDQIQFGDLFTRTQEVPVTASLGTGNFLVPGRTRVMVTLDMTVSTERTRQGDRLTMTIRTPSRYEGAVIEAFVARVNGSERLSGRADLALVFDRIRLRDGRTYQFAGVIESVRAPGGEAIIEGRDQLDLPRGSELTIISSTPRGRSESTRAQR